MRYYFDYNASAPMSEEVKDYIISIIDKAGNPSSIHNSGREAKSILEKARKEISLLINCDKKNIIFTSGATEANNLALNGYEHKIVSSVEHESIRNQNNTLCVDVDKKGYIKLDMLENIINSLKAHKNKIISIMFANNETGIIQPIDKINKIAKKNNILFHSDAVQVVGRLNVDFMKLGLDMITISSHKIGGPNGSGALVISSKKNIINPLFLGGQQEDSLRSGTEPLLSIAGFGAAAKILNINKINNIKNVKDYFESEIKNINMGIQIIGENSNRIPNTFMIYTPSIKAETLLIALDLEGFEVSTGSACSSGKAEPSRVLMKMGYNKEVASSVIRISLGIQNTKIEINKFIQVLTKIIKRLKNK